MILLDSMMVSGLRWVLSALGEAVMAERDDDTSLRAALLDAEVQHEAGALSDEEFEEVEESILARIREIRASRETGDGPITLVASSPDEPSESVQVEAAVVGDFNEAPPSSPRYAEPPDRRAPRGGQARRSARSG